MNSTLVKPVSPKVIAKAKPSRRAFFPLLALKLFGLSLLVLVGALCLLEYWQLPQLEAQGKIVPLGWQADNKKLFQENYYRNQASQADPVWRSAGFPVSETKKKSHRIAVIGDSFVWGDGYSNLNDLWWRQLEQELERRGYNDVEVIAAGLCGAPTKTQIEYGKTVVAKYHPDMLIWGYVTNDPDEGIVNQFAAPEKEPFIAAINQIFGKAFPRITAQLESLRQKKLTSLLANEKAGYEYFEWEKRLLTGENFSKYQDTVQQLAKFQAESKLPGFVMTLPIWPNKEHFGFRHDKVAPLFKQAGMPFFDTLNDFVAQYGNIDLNMDTRHGQAGNNGAKPLSWGINPVNGHPGILACHFYAVEAADELEKNHATILGAKQLTSTKPAGESKLAAESNLPVINDWLPVILFPEQKQAGAWEFQYPADKSRMLTMPIQKPYAQFNLAKPAFVQSIKLSGIDLEQAQVFITTFDHKNSFNNSEVRESKPQQSPVGQPASSGVTQAGAKEFVFDLNMTDAEPLSIIRISAKFKGPDRKLVMQLLPSKEVP